MRSKQQQQSTINQTNVTEADELMEEGYGWMDSHDSAPQTKATTKGNQELH